MLKQLRYVVMAAFFVSVTMAGTATAQAQLRFTIDPTQGLPGITVSGQVNPDDIAAHCTTDLAAFEAEFQAVLEGPFAGGSNSGELFLRFFPTGEFVFDTCDQAAYSLTGFTVLAIGSNIQGAAETALPQTFVMTFAVLATQQPVGELGHFDPVTGEGSVVVPDVEPGVWPVVATCVVPTLNVDLLEAGIRKNGAFLKSLGFTDATCDINSPEFAAVVAELLGPNADLFTFLSAYGPTFIQSIVVPGPLGLQLFTVLAQPQTKDECKNGGWQQFNVPAPGLGFRNQGDCIHFFNIGLHVGTTAATLG
jgi:hypothetical protein